MNLLEIIGESVELKKVWKNEYAGACPKCGGNDRFRVIINENKWYCRGCRHGGNDIEYFKWFENMDESEAMKATGTFKKKQSLPCKEAVKVFRKKSISSPDEKWIIAAGEFITRANKNLLNDKKTLEWLLNERGINVESAERNRIGVNHTDVFLDSKVWGVESESKMCLPAGIVIPIFNDEKIFSIKIRRFEKKEYGRYACIKGSANTPLIIGKGGIFVIVESELDAILLSQECSEDFTMIALGSCSTYPDENLIERLQKGRGILICLDSDDAGAKASVWWKENFSNSIRWAIPKKYGKDQTEFWKSKVFPLNEWLQMGADEINNPLPAKNSFDEIFEERAAIMEYEANMSREDAERKASDCIAWLRND